MNVRSPLAARFAPVVLVMALVLSLVAPASAAVAQTENEVGDHHVLIFTATTAFRHTEAINQGTPVLEQAFEEVGITSEHTEDSSVFNDEDLARFDALVMFQTSGDPWSEDEKAAMERYQQEGGGIVAIHNAADMRGGYDWWDDLIGSLMPSHAATSPPLGLEASVHVEDSVHPSTDHLPTPEWVRSDEWYNFSTNVRGDAHVLLTMDETTYNAGGDAMGYDHPISWCKPYDGGRAWITAMGHFGAHYTDEPDFVDHIVGGVQYAAGAEEGDCGGTVWDEYEQVPLDQDTSAPFAMDIASDGRVFFTEIARGQIRVYHPVTDTTTTALELDVYTGGEDGMLGIALDPDFDDNGHLFVYWSPASDDDFDQENWWNRLSRFTVDGNSQIDPDTEVTFLEVPTQRMPDTLGHTGGDVEFDMEGNLLLSVGDDVNPHSEPSPSSAPLSEIEGTFHDARETSANTNDLRGKLLRITPQEDGSYTIPEGNLFPEDEYDEGLTRPEIYAMGFRNPFRFEVDPHTNHIAMADYGPDAGNASQYGPAGMVSWSYITEPGNYGWPLCHGDRRPYVDVDYTTSPRTFGDEFDCDNPINDSVRNTGLEELPPVVMPDMVYGYQMSTVPAVIPAGGGLSPMAGPIYDYDPDLDVDTKFPEYYDGKPKFYEWSKNQVWTMHLDHGAEPGDRLMKVNEFLPQTDFLAPIDMKYGPDGSLYVLDWGGGFGRHNPNSGLYRIDYLGAQVPVADIQADPTSGPAPLEVSFDGTGSTDPDGGELTYEWDFEDDGEVDSTEAVTTHTYEENGTHVARLTVTNESDATGTATVTITVGNTAPTVEFAEPVDGGFFQFGDELSWTVDVSDPEDEQIVDDEISVVPSTVTGNVSDSESTQYGPTGSVETDADLHHTTDDLTYRLEASYTDQGTDVAPPLTTTSEVKLQPKRKQAEHRTDSEGVGTVASGDIESDGDALSGLSDGAWASYDPVNFSGIDEVTFRVSSTEGGGAIELRQDAVDGELLGTAEVPDTGGNQDWVDVTIDAPDTTDTMALYLVFTGEADFRLNFFEAVGQGLSTGTRPQVVLTSPEDGDIFDSDPVIGLEADASDEAHGVAQVEFFVDGVSVGTDAEAPYGVSWDEVPDGAFVLHARATNELGLTTHSRSIEILVGDEVVRPPWRTFASRGADFRQMGESSFIINAQGSNVWSGTDEYGSVYLPGAGDEQFFATVQIASQQAPNNSAKAGLIVRNDITDTGVGGAGGYYLVHRQGNSNFEALYDTSGDGTPNSADSMGGSSTPSWVAIGRDGDEFTGYASNDGDEWEIFSQITIDDANENVDVGMFVTAHDGTAYSEVRFENFTLSDELPDPSEPYQPPDDPDPVDPVDPDGELPPCIGLRSDDFSGAELDESVWPTVRGAEGDLPRIEDGALTLPITEGDIDGGNTGPISFVGQPMPEGEWEATVHLDIEHSNEWQHAGLMQHVDDDNYIKFAFTHNNSGERFFEFQTETDGSRAWHVNNLMVGGDFPTEVWMRLQSDGSQLTASYSTDGEDFEVLEGTAEVFGGGDLGIVGAGDTSSDTIDATVYSYTFAPDEAPADAGPNDEFEGTALNGCIWDRTVRYNPETLWVEDGQLHIETEPGDIHGGDNTDPRNFVLQDAPSGDWTIETQLDAPLLDNWQQGGLIAYADDGNYVKLDVVADNQDGTDRELRIELRSEIDDEMLGGPDIEPAPANDDDTWWLRLSKEGDTFSGQVSADGDEWVSMDDTVVNDALGDDYAVGLIAIGPQQSEPVVVSFDYFRVTEGAPVDEGVEAHLDPADPDGEQGWYVSPVTLTLETDVDGATPQWRHLGEEEWTDADDPVVFDEDGEYDLEYRATTGEGTAPTTHEVLVGQGGFVFVPDDLTVTQGDTVHYDLVSGFHDVVVVEDDGTEVDRSPLGSDWGSWDFEATEPGQYYFYCTPHATTDGADPANWTGMVGSLQVEAAEGEVVDPWTSEIGQVSFQLDQTPPETSVSVDGTSEGDVFVDEASVTLEADDNLSGVAETHIREAGDEDFDVYDSPVTYTGDGSYTIEFRSADVAGNVEEWQEISFEIVDDDTVDPTEPSVDVTLDPPDPDGQDGWYVSPVTIGLSSDDDDATLEWRLAGYDDWLVFDGPVTVDADGVYEVEYRATNEAGTSDLGEVSFRIDQTLPETTAQVDGSTEGDAFVDEAAVSLDAEDNLSGVAETHIRVAGAEEHDVYDGPVTYTGEGSYTVEFRSADVAGNVENWQAVSFDIVEEDDEMEPVPPPHGDVCARHQGGATFPDAPGSGHKRFIDCLAELGVVEGYTDGTFGPRDDVSRGQLASFVVRALELATGERMSTGGQLFPDVGVNATHGQAIYKLRNAGVIRGYEDGTFRPSESVSREQTARYVVNALELVLDADLERSEVWFTDVPAGSLYAADIDKLVTAGVVSGFGDGTFGPRQPVTRAQMTRFIGNTLGVLDDADRYDGP